MTWLSDEALARLRSAAVWPEFDNARYTVDEEIGRGGMGTVYLARDRTLDRDVAIKVSNVVAAESSDHGRRVQLEARILARLEHPGIVPIHEIGRLADGRLYYVMKRVRGRTLLDLLGEEAGAGSAADREGERLRIFERICDPVAFAHAHGCIHRDLKPENVMVGAFGEVMVMDWGVAKLRSVVDLNDSDKSSAFLDALGAPPPSASRSRVIGSRLSTGSPGSAMGGDSSTTHAGTVLGTPGFMPPEQASGGARDVDERADVYGLGAMLFTLLSGEAPPPTAEAAVAAVNRHPKIPAALKAICSKALAASPSDRYDGVPALAADVARYRAGQAVTAHRETFIERTARFGRTYRTPILLVLAYMLMRALVALAARR